MPDFANPQNSVIMTILLWFPPLVRRAVAIPAVPGYRILVWNYRVFWQPQGSGAKTTVFRLYSGDTLLQDEIWKNFTASVYPFSVAPSHFPLFRTERGANLEFEFEVASVGPFPFPPLWGVTASFMYTLDPSRVS